MKRFLIGISLVPLLLLSACSTLAGSSPSQPDVSSYQYLDMTLIGLIKAGYDDEKLALTHEQAQKIIVLVQKWKTGLFGLNKAEAKAVYDSVVAVLTLDQRAWHPRPRGGVADMEDRPPPTPDEKPTDGSHGGKAQRGPPGGGRGPLLTEDYLKLYNELIDQLGLI